MLTQQQTSRPIAILALLLAWIVPGLGHIYLKRYTRGIIIMVVIAASFWTGVAFGGALTVDYYQERWWFLADMFTGVHGLSGWYMQKKAYEGAMLDPHFREMLQRSEDDPNLRKMAQNGASKQAIANAAQASIQPELDAYFARKKIALVQPMDIVARAFAGVAGLLNMMCIFDATMLAIMGVTGEKRKQDDPPARPEAA